MGSGRMVGKPEVIQNGVLGSLRRTRSTWTINALIGQVLGPSDSHISSNPTYRELNSTSTEKSDPDWNWGWTSGVKHSSEPHPKDSVPATFPSYHRSGNDGS